MTPEIVRQIIRDELRSLLKTDRYTFERLVQFADGRNIQVGVGTGTQIGTSPAQKIGFLGSSPIIQQTASSQSPATFNTQSSGIADGSATWNGYTIGDIVAILEAFGFIA